MGNWLMAAAQKVAVGYWVLAFSYSLPIANGITIHYSLLTINYIDLLLRCNDHDHSLSFKQWHFLQFAVLNKFLGKLEHDDFTLLFVHD